MSRLNVRNFVFVAIAIVANVAARDTTVQEWIPHVQDWAFSLTAILLILTILFQIKKRGWKIIGRGLIYLYRFLAWWTQWTEPNSLPTEIRKQHLLFKREDHPIELTLFGAMEVLDEPELIALTLRIDNYSSEIEHAEEFAFHAEGDWLHGMEINGWEFATYPEHHKKNGHFHSRISDTAPSFFNIVISKAPFLGHKLDSIQCKVIMASGAQIASNILKIPDKTGIKFKRTAS